MPQHNDPILNENPQENSISVEDLTELDHRNAYLQLAYNEQINDMMADNTLSNLDRVALHLVYVTSGLPIPPEMRGNELLDAIDAGEVTMSTLRNTRQSLQPIPTIKLEPKRENTDKPKTTWEQLTQFLVYKNSGQKVAPELGENPNALITTIKQGEIITDTQWHEMNEPKRKLSSYNNALSQFQPKRIKQEPNDSFDPNDFINDGYIITPTV